MSLSTTREERCWACGEHFTAATWDDRHSAAADDPDHAEYHAECCPNTSCPAKHTEGA